MELTTAMLRYERARARALDRAHDPDPEVLTELAAARVDLMRLLGESGDWNPAAELLAQQHDDEALLAERPQDRSREN